MWRKDCNGGCRTERVESPPAGPCCAGSAVSGGLTGLWITQRGSQLKNFKRGLHTESCKELTPARFQLVYQCSLEMLPLTVKESHI